MEGIDLIKIFGAFFAIMNPFVNLPIFIGLTEEFSVDQKRILATKIALFSAAMCGVILLAGNMIIGFFGITIDQFRIAGGLVLAHIAWSMLNGSNLSSHHGTTSEQAQMKELSSLAFYPITFPIIVGPGTIATLIIYAGHSANLTGLLSVGAIVASILTIMFAVFFFSSNFDKLLSDTMRTITTRLMGMILLAISVEMIVGGISAVFPILAPGK